MTEEDIVKKELMNANDKNEGPLSPKDLYERTGLSATQVSTGIKILLMKKKITAISVNREFSYKSI